MKIEQKKFIEQMHYIGRIKFWKINKDYNFSEQVLIGIIYDSGRPSDIDGSSKIDKYNIELKDLVGVGVSELSKRAHMPKSAVSRGLAMLEDKGFIERAIDSNDRRNTVVTFTEDGLKAAKQIILSTTEYLDDVFGKFGEDKLFRLTELLSELTEVASKELNKRIEEQNVGKNKGEK